MSYSECGDLVVSVIEGKDLMCNEHSQALLDTFVCVYLLPERTANMQTRVKSLFCFFDF